MSRMLYVSPADIQANGVIWAAVKNMTPTVILDTLANASALADSYLSSRYRVPFLTYGPDLKRAVLDVAIYDLLSARGMSLDGSDANYRARYQDALKWLGAINNGTAQPIGAIDSAGAGNGAGSPDGGSQGMGSSGTTPLIVTTSQRGW